MRRLVLLAFLLFITAGMVMVHAQTPLPHDGQQGTVTLPPSTPKLTAVDPYAYPISTDVLPARPFLYTVDNIGITVTRFNDNQVVGTWPWPRAGAEAPYYSLIYTVTPDGGFVGLTPPATWEPVAMVVSYPTAAEFGNRVKPIPDLTPPATKVYVVMAHSGYEWRSVGGFRDTIVPSTDPARDSSILIQLDVSDPSFSASQDPANPVPPHMAAALLGHGAGQPVYDRATGNVWVGNMPSTSLPTGLSTFISVIGRIPDTVAETEAEVPGISIPVIRCGPQHPENGIPVGRPQAFACYDPGGVHPIEDNEHVGAYGELKQWDPANPNQHQEQYVWEFRSLPSWLTPHRDKVSGEFDGILYGTPPATGEWFAEARVHNLDDEFGVFSDWTPIRLLVTPTAEYLPVKVQFGAGVPVAYPLEGTGSCALTAAPAWVDVAQVPNGCIVMGRAPLDGEHYNFRMPGFTVAGYPGLSLVFSGDVFGEYGFVPLPTGVGISGMGWHQVSKVADPSTESAVLSLEYIGVDAFTGQLYRILAPPGKPQPPNERPPETALTLAVVTPEGLPLLNPLLQARPDIAGALTGNLKVKFGDLAIEADRDIFVTASQIVDPTSTTATAVPIGGSTIVNGAVMKVNGPATTTISLPNVQASFVDLDSDLRPAIIGVELGQVDHGALWVSGTTTGNVAVIDTGAGTVFQTLQASPTAPLGSVSVDFGTQYAYVVAQPSHTIAIFGPMGTMRPLMRPRIWSAEEFTWNLGQAAQVPVMATGDGVPALALIGNVPPGLTFTDNGDGTATISGTPTAAGGGGGTGGELDVEGGDYAMTITATSATGTYAQAFGITVQSPPSITSGNTATFIAGATNSFTVFGSGWPTPIFYVLDAADLPAGLQLVDNEDGTASLRGAVQTPGTYTFTIHATTDCPPDADQTFTLTVLPAGVVVAPTITSGNTVTWEAVGAPFSPDLFTVTSIGSPTPTLSVTGTLPPGVTFIDNGDSTGTLGAGCLVVWPGSAPSCLGFLAAGTEGTYNFTIRATNAGGTVAQPFTMVLARNETLMGTTPATLSFAYITDGAMPAVQTVHLTTMGATDMPYALVTTENWIHVTPISGLMPGDIQVSVDPSVLTVGTYTGTIIIGSAGTEGPPATIAVTLTVADAPAPGMLAVAPGFLSFAQNIDAAPGPQTITVATGGGTVLPYTVTTNVPWLIATPNSGTTPANVSVQVNAAALTAGIYNGTVTIGSASAINLPQSVGVTLIKTGAGGLVKAYVGIGSGPEGIALNRYTNELFINASNEPPGAPENESGGEVPVPEPNDPNAVYSVFHFDPTAKGGKVVAQVIVHGEGEYIAVNSKLWCKDLPGQPNCARVYQASEATGEVAVIDARTNTVLTFIPLTFEGASYTPYQIAVDEGQNIIYVGAKAPPIPDPPFPMAGCKAIHEMPDDEYDCWNPGRVFVIDGATNKIVSSFLAGDDPEGVVFAAATGKVYVSNEDDGSITVAKGAVRKGDGTILPARVLSTIIRGVPVKGWWQPTCDENNYCGERGQAALWPTLSACNGLDDEAEEADKMTVDPHGNVYIIDDRYRVAKINGRTDYVDTVLDIPGYQCELEVPDGSEVIFPNTANNIAFNAPSSGVARFNPNGKGWRLYVTSEQNTVSVIDPISMTIKSTLLLPQAMHLDAIVADAELNRVYITDEELGALFALEGKCANGDAAACLK